MFTGLYPTQIKLTGKYLDRLSDKVPILTEILKDLGYITLCYTENPWVSSYFRVTKGFHKIFKNNGLSFHNIGNTEVFESINFILNLLDRFIKKRIRVKRYLDYWKKFKQVIEELNKRMLQNIFWKTLLRDYKNTINLIEKFNQILPSYLNGRPLYLFLNIMATHCPYIPQKEALNYVNITPKDFKILKNLLLNPSFYFNKINLRSKSLTEKQIKTLKKLYDSSVYYSDMIVEKLFSVLQNLGLLENSYVIITSDHGELLGSQIDHYLYGHGIYQSVLDSQIKVPLIIYHPKFYKRIIEDQVELKDVFHTILHLVGIPDDKNKYLNLQKSLINQIESNTTPKYIYGENLKLEKEIKTLIEVYKRFVKADLIQKIFSDICFLRSESYKYVKFEQNIEEFYDLINDPHEQVNIISDDLEEYHHMKHYLTGQLKKIKNLKNLTEIMTIKEKSVIRKAINDLKI